MWFNDEKILQDADILDMCNRLGIKAVRRGANTFIRCPEHKSRTGKEDTALDKCYIKKGRYYCFSCGASGNVIHLVQNTFGYHPQEARKIICELLGGVDMYLDKGHSNAEEFPYNKRELEALGLNMVAYGDIPKFLTESKDELEISGKYEYHERSQTDVFVNLYGKVSAKENPEFGDRFLGHLYVGCDRVSENLRTLYMEDKDTFKWLIKNKAVEMSQKYREMLSCNIAGKILPQEEAYYVNSIYKNYLGICERILKAS